MFYVIYALIALLIFKIVALLSYNEILNALSEKAFEHFSEPNNIWDKVTTQWEYFRYSHTWIALSLAFAIYGLAFFAHKINRSKAAVWNENFIRVGMAGMFIFASYHKIIDPAFFAKQVAAYQFLPDWSIYFFAKTLPFTEFFVGLGLLFSKYNKENGLFLTGMFIMFIIALGRAAILGLGIDCGCFESSTGGEDKSSVIIALVRDIVLLPACVWLMFRPNRMMFFVFCL